MNIKKYYIQLMVFSLCMMLSSCKETSEEEKELKVRFDQLISNAETTEQKDLLKEQYEQALKELREELAEKEKRDKIFYSKENDVSTELFALCDEIWKDKNFNPAKFQVKSKEFQYKSIAFSGKIASISSLGNDNYITMDYKKEDKWIFERKIKFSFYFEKPEDIMDLKEGQEVSIHAIYDDGFEDAFGVDYNFHFYHSTIEK